MGYDGPGPCGRDWGEGSVTFTTRETPLEVKVGRETRPDGRVDTGVWTHYGH